MNSLTIVFVCFIACVAAWDHHHGPIVGASGVVDAYGAKGPAGSVSGHGAIGPNGEHNAVGGHWDEGHSAGGWGGHGGYGGHGGHYSNVVHAHGATLYGPTAGQSSHTGHGHFVLKGPATIPVTIYGPSGKVHAEGLYGPKHY